MDISLYTYSRSNSNAYFKVIYNWYLIYFLNSRSIVLGYDIFPTTMARKIRLLMSVHSYFTMIIKVFRSRRRGYFFRKLAKKKKSQYYILYRILYHLEVVRNWSLISYNNNEISSWYGAVVRKYTRLFSGLPLLNQLKKMR